MHLYNFCVQQIGVGEKQVHVYILLCTKGLPAGVWAYHAKAVDGEGRVF